MSFNGIEDHWEAVIERHWRNSELDASKKQEVLAAMAVLKEELGQGILVPGPLANKYPLTTREMFSHPLHPVHNMIVFVSTFNINRIIKLAYYLKEVKQHCINYPSLVEKLKDKNKFLEGFSFLEAAYRFSKAGFDIEIEPHIDGKIPDLQLVDRENCTKVIAELTVLKNSRGSSNSIENLIRISELIEKYHNGIQGEIKVFNLLDERDLDSIIPEMLKTISEVKETKQEKTLLIANKLELKVRPKEGSGGGLSMTGSPYKDTGVYRVIGRVKEKYIGLPKIYPKIVILHDNYTFIPDPEVFTKELGNIISELPELLFFVVINSYITTTEPGEIKKNYGSHLFIKKYNDGDIEKDFVIINDRCIVSIPQSTMKKLLSSYESGY